MRARTVATCGLVTALETWPYAIEIPGLGGGSGTTFNGFVIAAQSCRMTVLSNISTAVAAGDLIIPRVTSGTLPDGVFLQPYVVGADGDVVRILCNGTGVDASLTGPMQIAFRRIR